MTATRYLGALLAVAIGVGLALWLDPVVDATVVLLMAVLATAWFAGLGPALLASVAGTLALDFFFTPPLYTLTLKVAHISHLLMFAVIAVLFATASAGRRQAERSLRQARDQLEEKVKERTADLERTHAQAMAAQQRFRDLVDAVEGIVWEADARTLQFTFVSEQAERMLGYPVEQWLSEPAFWSDHIHPDDRAQTVQSYIATAQHRRRKHDFEYRMIAANGQSVWLRDLVSVLREGTEAIKLRGVMVDVTERKRTEQELEDLAGRLIHAQEQERSRIGRELHDHISQMLGVLAIRIDQLLVDEATTPAVAAALEEIRHSTSELTDDVHSLSHRLHSSALDYLGLVPALQKLTKEFASRHSIAVAFAHDAVPARLPSEVALSLFRVTEEGLNNIAKHSHARSARVDVSGGADGLRLTIEDAGAGFDIDSLEGRAGLGFVSMRERLRALRGTVHVDSAPSRGTRIDVLVPAASLAAPPVPSPVSSA